MKLTCPSNARQFELLTKPRGGQACRRGPTVPLPTQGQAMTDPWCLRSLAMHIAAHLCYREKAPDAKQSKYLLLLRHVIGVCVCV